MNPDEYALLLGKLVANLQSLEFALRAFLYKKKDGQHNEFDSDSIYELKVGGQVPVNAFTDYSLLEELIKRYNKYVKSDLKVDKSIVVPLRDALAHGRIARKSGSHAFRIVKYDGPIKKGQSQTTLKYSEELSKEWLKAQIKQVRDSLKKVADVTVINLYALLL